MQTRGVRGFSRGRRASAAGVQAELGQKVGVLAVLGVYLVRELLAGLLSLVVVALALQQLDDLVLADVH